MTVDEQEEYNGIYGDIRTLVDENLAKFAVGDRPMSEWDDFVQQIHDLGIDRCIEIEQEAVDRVYNRSL